MSTYVVGDLQGCLDELKRLLDAVGFDPAADTLWLTGDLVNRGPDSLATLKFVRSLEPNLVTVLGNHDLHLLAVALTESHAAKPKDTFQDVLESPVADEYLEWLRHRPLVHYDASFHALLVHAGLPPGWQLEDALDAAAHVEALLRADDAADFLEALYGNEPARYDPTDGDLERARYTVNALTRMRFVTAAGELDFEAKGPPGSQPVGLIPWFEHPDFVNRRGANPVRILFGHWSTLHIPPELERALAIHPLDTGAVWGGALSAIRLEDRERFQVISSIEVAIDE